MQRIFVSLYNTNDACLKCDPDFKLNSKASYIINDPNSETSTLLSPFAQCAVHCVLNVQALHICTYIVSSVKGCVNWSEKFQHLGRLEFRVSCRNINFHEIIYIHEIFERVPPSLRLRGWSPAVLILKLRVRRK